MSADKNEWPLMEEVFRAALTRAGAALSDVACTNVSLRDFSLTYSPLHELPELFGRPSTPVAASFFRVTGDLSGYLVFLIPVDEADRLLDNMLAYENVTPGLASSALGEIGNIVGSTFLNYVADTFQFRILPSPPQVVRDMVGALMGTLASILAAEGIQKLLMIRTTWESEQHKLRSHLVWLPGTGQLERLGGLP